MYLLHLYADDTFVYYHTNSIALDFDHLQIAFDIIRSHLFHFKLVLNADKMKRMLSAN